jgi:hypothetical protein
MPAHPLTRMPRLAQAYALVALLDLVGAVVAVGGGLDGARRAIVSGTPINAPIPFLAAQLAIVAVATALAGRRIGTAAAALLAALGTVSVLSGFGDGSFHHALSAPERAIQLGVVAATALTVLFALAQVTAALRGPRPAATAA